MNAEEETVTGYGDEFECIPVPMEANVAHMKSDVVPDTRNVTKSMIRNRNTKPRFPLQCLNNIMDFNGCVQRIDAINESINAVLVANTNNASPENSATETVFQCAISESVLYPDCSHLNTTSIDTCPLENLYSEREQLYGRIDKIQKSLKRKQSKMALMKPHPKSRGLIDSGASMSISGQISHFAHIDYSKPVSVKVADGKALPGNAYFGTLHPNKLGLSRAIFHPRVSHFLLSTSELKKIGLTTVFSPTIGDHIAREKTHEIFYMHKDEKTGLPTVDVGFQDTYTVSAEEGQGMTSEARAMHVDFSRKSGISRLRLHQRMGHISLPGVVIRCPACDLAKSKGAHHGHTRPPENRPSSFNDEVHWDFVGPYEPDAWGNRWLLNSIDAHTRWSESYICQTRDQCGDRLRAWAGRNSIPRSVRTDNAPEFKGPKGPWKKAAAQFSPPVRCDFSPPYEPSENGLVERFNQSSANGIRSMLVGCDRRLWSYAAKAYSYIANRLPKQKTDSPFVRRYKRAPTLYHLRRFGCLAYCKIYQPDGKLADRFARGVFLGYGDENSTYLVGMWVKDKRTKSKNRFVVVESKVVKFDESILIANIDSLRPESTKIETAYPDPHALNDGDAPAPSVPAVLQLQRGLSGSET